MRARHRVGLALSLLLLAILPATRARAQESDPITLAQGQRIVVHLSLLGPDGEAAPITSADLAGYRLTLVADPAGSLLITRDRYPFAYAVTPALDFLGDASVTATFALGAEELSDTTAFRVVEAPRPKLSGLRLRASPVGP